MTDLSVDVNLTGRWVICVVFTGIFKGTGQFCFNRRSPNNYTRYFTMGASFRDTVLESYFQMVVLGNRFENLRTIEPFREPFLF